MMAIRTREDADAFVLGLTLLSTGGGGLGHRGRSYLHALLDEGIEIGWTEIDELAPSARSCSVFGMGSVAPKEDMTERERVEFGVGKQIIPRPGVRAIEELGRFMGSPIDVVIPFELGAFNTVVAVDAASRLKIPLVDGDFIGRALPEMSQALPAVMGLRVWPLAIADQWGNSLMMMDCPSTRVAERIGKLLSTVTKAPDMLATCAHAAFPLSIGEATPAVVSGSLSRALAVGRRVVQAREESEDPASAVAGLLDGYVLFRGVVADKKWEDGEGYMTGVTTLAGIDSFSDSRSEIWFKNENHILTVNGKPRAMSPDIISVIDASDGEPLTNTELMPGQRVAVLGFRADPRYRHGEGLTMTDPKHYGFDLDYAAIETLGP